MGLIFLFRKKQVVPQFRYHGVSFGVFRCELREVLMTIQHPLQRLRVVLGFALIGSALTGVVFGHADLSVDPRTIGASAGALLGALKAFELF